MPALPDVISRRRQGLKTPVWTKQASWGTHPAFNGGPPLPNLGEGLGVGAFPAGCFQHPVRKPMKMSSRYSNRSHNTSERVGDVSLNHSRRHGSRLAAAGPDEQAADRR